MTMEAKDQLYSVAYPRIVLKFSSNIPRLVNYGQLSLNALANDPRAVWSRTSKIGIGMFSVANYRPEFIKWTVRLLMILLIAVLLRLSRIIDKIEQYYLEKEKIKVREKLE